MYRTVLYLFVYRGGKDPYGILMYSTYGMDGYRSRKESGLVCDRATKPTQRCVASAPTAVIVLSVGAHTGVTYRCVRARGWRARAASARRRRRPCRRTYLGVYCSDDAPALMRVQRLG